MAEFLPVGAAGAWRPSFGYVARGNITAAVARNKERTRIPASIAIAAAAAIRGEEQESGTD